MTKLAFASWYSYPPPFVLFCFVFLFFHFLHFFRLWHVYSERAVRGSLMIMNMEEITAWLIKGHRINPVSLVSLFVLLKLWMWSEIQNGYKAHNQIMAYSKFILLKENSILRHAVFVILLLMCCLVLHLGYSCEKYVALCCTKGATSIVQLQRCFM